MRFILALALPMLLPTFAHAQGHHEMHHPMAVPSVTATAEGIVTVEPNLAEIEVAVVTEAKTAPQAAKENAAKLTKVLTELKKLLGPGDEMKTVGYSLSPNYRHAKEGGKPEIIGYSASNTVRVKIAALDGVGKLIDTATQSGANRIERLVFTLKDEDAAKREALRLATTKARSKAEAIAQALGQKIKRVMSVTEGEQVFRPMVRQMAEYAPSRATTTPVETGSVEVRASVTLTAELSGQ